MHLLDVNILIALGDPYHVHHTYVVAWFNTHRRSGWATCPLTENGFLRILGQPQYPKGPGTTERARLLLNRLCAEPGHQFFPDSPSLCDTRAFPRLPTSKHLTDIYLLALALANHARLVTLDRNIDPTLLPGGPAAYHVLDAS